MRSKKIFGVILFTILIAVITILPTISNAATLNPSLYFGITEVQPNSTQNGQSLGYAIGNPAAPDNGPKIWNIVQFSNSSYSDPTATSDVYCIRAGFGFSLDENGKKQAEYTNSFDLKTEMLFKFSISKFVLIIIFRFFVLAYSYTLNRFCFLCLLCLSFCI